MTEEIHNITILSSKSDVTTQYATKTKINLMYPFIVTPKIIINRPKTRSRHIIFFYTNIIVNIILFNNKGNISDS